MVITWRRSWFSKTILIYLNLSTVVSSATSHLFSQIIFAVTVVMEHNTASSGVNDITFLSRRQFAFFPEQHHVPQAWPAALLLCCFPYVVEVQQTDWPMSAFLQQPFWNTHLTGPCSTATLSPYFKVAASPSQHTVFRSFLSSLFLPFSPAFLVCFFPLHNYSRSQLVPLFWPTA